MKKTSSSKRNKFKPVIHKGVPQPVKKHPRLSFFKPNNLPGPGYYNSDIQVLSKHRSPTKYSFKKSKTPSSSSNKTMISVGMYNPKYESTSKKSFNSISYSFSTTKRFNNNNNNKSLNSPSNKSNKLNSNYSSPASSLYNNTNIDFIKKKVTYPLSFSRSKNERSFSNSQNQNQIVGPGSYIIDNRITNKGKDRIKAGVIPPQKRSKSRIKILNSKNKNNSSLSSSSNLYSSNLSNSSPNSFKFLSKHRNSTGYSFPKANLHNNNSYINNNNNPSSSLPFYQSIYPNKLQKRQSISYTFPKNSSHSNSPLYKKKDYSGELINPNCNYLSKYRTVTKYSFPRSKSQIGNNKYNNNNNKIGPGDYNPDDSITRPNSTSALIYLTG